MVCVDDSPGYYKSLPCPLVKDDTYTISTIKVVDDDLMLELHGVGPWANGDVGFNSRRFRPLDALTEQLERIESEGAPVELEPEYA